MSPKIDVIKNSICDRRRDATGTAIRNYVDSVVTDHHLVGPQLRATRDIATVGGKKPKVSPRPLFIVAQRTIALSNLTVVGDIG
ncbi:MAG: hypothetical protein OEQ39_09510 [Gammaproteobacteria bacterium]|nr:hypothetical protein [Gammaproteobacteria bacterium]MDH3464504.1 hypothetical protein [Gammaproteobacteria bacterium]